MADEPEDAELPADDTVPPIDFTTFVLSLSTSALASLGEDTSGADPKLQLALARQTIDLLVLLEDKTQGNLTGEEERLLAQVLTDLKLKYVTKAKG
jgi:hypothetical protein